MPTFDLTFESGETSLSVRQFAVQEAVSELFTVSVLAMSRRPDLDMDSFIGQAASLRIETGILHAALDARLWEGVCSQVEQVQPEPTGLSTYSLTIVPKLWLLTQRRGQRIYQHLSIPEIADRLLAEWAIVPVWKVDRAACPKLEIRMQHGESDYAFLSRLLEEAGIAFTLPDNGATKTTLTFSDKLHVEPPRRALPFVDNPNEASQKEFVTQVRLTHEVRPGKVTMRDNEFRKPRLELSASAPLAPPVGPEAKLEQYRFEPGSFLARGAGGGTPFADDRGAYRHEERHGKDLSARVLAAMRGDRRVVSFETNVVDLAPGRVFTIEHHPHTELDAGELLVTDLAITGSPGEAWTVQGRAVLTDAKVPYRPPRKTPKPQALGLQSAVVVGPPGAEIHTDEHGRVRVQFAWDREGRLDDNSSCWMRVSQGWAGAGYGMFLLPRVGQEVLVACLDGDPDQPIVAGRAHNGQQVPPYRLPDHKTVSTWKSSSSPHTGGYNEIKFEDQAGMELVYTQAQRDKHELVKRDQVERTGRNKLSTVVGDEDLVVRGTRKRLVMGGEHVHVVMNRSEQVNGSASLTVMVDQHERVGLSHALEAGAAIHLKAGATMVLEAGLRLTIKGPGGFIDIHPGGIDIVGTIVNINSGGEAGSGPGASPSPPRKADEAHPGDTPVP
ncbi:type VI secretion system tip protein TssI/VgrG [Sorangium sp. So ce321]|uniref:type VI secretion system Vgr family protein n=1 Tax=Sorangium sp. So ce321 TaxID=3133300 RepID=UPI003F6316B3